MLIEKEIIELVNEVREKLNIEVARMVDLFRQSEFLEDFSEHTPLSYCSFCSVYFLEEIFEKVLGVEYERYWGEYEYLNFGEGGIHGFKIGMKDIICTPGKTLAGLCAETTDAIFSEYFRIRLTAVYMNDVFETDEWRNLEYRLFKAMGDKNYKDLFSVFAEYQYYSEDFKKILINNGYYVVTLHTIEGGHEIPCISIQDSEQAPYEIPLCKVVKTDGDSKVFPRTILEILLCIIDQELMFLDGFLPSAELIWEHMDLHNKIEYSGYSAEEVKRLFELGQKGYSTKSELKAKLEKQGFSVEDEEAYRIALCGCKYKDMKLDIVPKTWYRFGCPYLLENGKYLPSLNYSTRKREDGVSVVTTEWLSENGPWLLEDSFERMGIWKIQGIQIGEGPVVYPLGLAEKTDISSVDELRKAVESAV